MMNKKPPINTSRSWYIKPSTIFLPKIRRSHLKKRNASVVKHQDILQHSTQRNLISKLYPVTRPIRLRRISLPKKLTKKEISQKIPQKKNQQLTLTQTTKKRIFPKVTRNHA